MGKVIAVANQKGGVGKTTTTINLSAALAKAGAKVLVVDCDPQGNTTSGLGFSKSEIKRREDNTSYELMTTDIELNECILKTSYNINEEIALVPSNVNLSAAETELNNIDGKNYILRDKLQKGKEEYDYILIDCPPSLTVLTINALTAANSVLIPIQCEFYALEGLSQLLQTIELTRLRLNTELTIEGILFTMYDTRNNLSKEVVDNVRSSCSDHIFNTIIPRSIKLAEAPSFGRPICLYDPKSAGAVAYDELAGEIIGADEDWKKKANIQAKKEIATSRSGGKVVARGTTKRAMRKEISRSRKKD